MAGARRAPEGPPPDPAVQRLRVRFAKRGRLRFTSHRDFQRAFERALRRVDVPMAYSAGFSPHPRISYAGAAPTGAASEAEYVEISVTRRCEPDALARELDAALPPGLDIVSVTDAGDEAKGALVERLEASLWQIELPGVTSAAAAEAVATLLSRESAPVERLTKQGVRRFDARPPIVSLVVLEARAGDGGAGGSAGPASDPCAILHLVVRHMTPAVRPDDVLAALRQEADLAPSVAPRVTRLAQGPLDQANGTVADPLAPDPD